MRIKLNEIEQHKIYWVCSYRKNTFDLTSIHPLRDIKPIKVKVFTIYELINMGYVLPHYLLQKKYFKICVPFKKDDTLKKDFITINGKKDAKDYLKFFDNKEETEREYLKDVRKSLKIEKKR